jgi:hypothetical protein
MPEGKSGWREQFGPLFAGVGVVGTAITLFSNLQSVLDMADWARFVVSHWTEWTRAFWDWVFGWIGVKLPQPLVPILTTCVFFAMLAAGPTATTKRTMGLAALNTVSMTFCGAVLVMPGMATLMAWLMQISERSQEYNPFNISTPLTTLECTLLTISLLFLLSFVTLLGSRPKLKDRAKAVYGYIVISIWSIYLTAAWAVGAPSELVAGILFIGLLQAPVFLYFYLRMALPGGLRAFSWKPPLVAATVLALLALNWVSMLDLAPLLKAPKV